MTGRRSPCCKTADLIVILATVLCKTSDHRRLLVDVTDYAINYVVYAVGNTELQRRVVHQLRDLQIQDVSTSDNSGTLHAN